MIKHGDKFTDDGTDYIIVKSIYNSDDEGDSIILFMVKEENFEIEQLKINFEERDESFLRRQLEADTKLTELLLKKENSDGFTK